MGFYGKVTNLTNASLNFDKIYPNKFFMDSSIDMDSILVSRYVLVEYDTQGFYPEVKQDASTEDWYFFYDSTYGNKITFLKTGIRGKIIDSNDIIEEVYEEGNLYLNEIVVEKVTDYNWIFYKPTLIKEEGKEDKVELIKYASIETKTKIEEMSFYDLNYELDKAITGKAFNKPFDSTVYVKTKKDGEIQYLAIAELNSVVPSFNLTVKPPQKNGQPGQPYFDKDSTNVLYNLHMYTQPGIRIKETDGINFNKKGFDSTVKDYRDNSEDKITLTLSGQSGIIYDNNVSGGNQPPDILELAINLPSIGNTIGEVWDIVYGENRDESEEDSLVGKFNAIDKVENGKILIKSNDNKLIGLNIEDDNNWISTSFSDDKSNLTISHKINEKLQENNKLQELDYYENQDNIDEDTISIPIPTPRIDKAGHVIGYNDTLAQFVSNNRIVIKKDSKDQNKIIIEHDLVNPASVEPIVPISLAKPKREENESDEEFEKRKKLWQDNMNQYFTKTDVVVETFGHVTQINKTKYTDLPIEAFSTIKTNDNNSLSAIDYQDELNLTTDNILNTSADIDKKAIIISHNRIDNFNSETGFGDDGKKTLSIVGNISENTIDLSNNKFTTYQLTINDAGHIVGFIPYTVQYSGSSWIDIE